jgi:hypothetical protein
MNLYIWSGFPDEKQVKGFALANNVNEARELIINSFSKSEIYNVFREFLNNNDPVIYNSPSGWLQEVGSQYI